MKKHHPVLSALVLLTLTTVATAEPPRFRVDTKTLELVVREDQKEAYLLPLELLEQRLLAVSISKTGAWVLTDDGTCSLVGSAKKAATPSVPVDVSKVRALISGRVPSVKTLADAGRLGFLALNSGRVLKRDDLQKAAVKYFSVGKAILLKSRGGEVKALQLKDLLRLGLELGLYEEVAELESIVKDLAQASRRSESGWGDVLGFVIEALAANKQLEESLALAASFSGSKPLSKVERAAMIATTGRVLLANDDGEAALQAFKTSAQAGPDEPGSYEAWYWLGLGALVKGDIAGQETATKQVCRLVKRLRGTEKSDASQRCLDLESLRTAQVPTAEALRRSSLLGRIMRESNRSGRK